MPDTVYFCSNHQSQFDRSASTVVGVTTGGTFDSAVVDSSVVLPATAINNAPVFFAGMPLVNGGPSLTTKVYGHFQFYTTTVDSGTNNLFSFFIRVRNASGQVVFRIDSDSSVDSTFRCQYWDGGTFINVGSTFALSSIGLNTYDFEFTPGALGSFVLRLNGGIVPIVSVSGFAAAVDNFAVVDVANYTTDPANISQGCLANFDLRGAKVVSNRPAANGFYTDGTGTFSDVNTVATNDTTGIGLTAVAQKKTFTKAAFSTTGMVIKSAFVNILGAVSGGVVTNVRPITRRAGSDYTAANFPTPAAGLEQRQATLTVDPSTGIAWTVANYNAAEIGVEAR